MYQLRRAHLVQFFLFQAETLELDLTTAIVAPNGAGKSALLDALQIVMLGGDRNQIRFNAQAGGTHRARTIRDYCLGVHRAGDDGRVRETATTYVSLVFEDQASGETLTAGIALGASAAEPEHRLHGLYLLPNVALSLDDHLEIAGGEELPQEWARFRELIARRCKQAGAKAELHTASERFVKDLLFRLRPAPTAQLDAAAYRKAFQNALNLQRIGDIDLFVRTLVAEERPTEIARFRALLDGFRQIKEKIEQVARRIEQARQAAEHYRKVAQQATRAASYRALGAEYERDLHAAAVEAAELALETAAETLGARQRALEQARSDRQSARLAAEDAARRLQGTRGYAEQASFEQAAAPYREELARLKNELLRAAAFVRDQLHAAARLGVAGAEAEALETAAAPWRALHEQVAALAAEAAIDAAPEALHAALRRALVAAAPALAAIADGERERHNALDEARQRLRAAQRNLERADAGQAELRPDVVRLLAYFEEEGIPARPVCDLVQVTDPAWQRAIEAYLRTHVEALLVPAGHEERAVRLYRSLQGGRAVYGVKLALAGQARAARAKAPAAGQVAALLAGEDADALAYLRRQLGDLRCVDTDAEIVRSAHGLSRDGLLAKGGGVERLKLPAATELKIGASSRRDRRKLLREEIDAAERRVRELEAQWKPLGEAMRGLAPLVDAEAVVGNVHGLLLAHRQAAARHAALQESRAAASDPDLMRLSEQAEASRRRLDELEAAFERLLGEKATAEQKRIEAEAALQQLHARTEAVTRRAVEAFAQADVDADLVERQREKLDAEIADPAERLERCRKRADESEHQLRNLLPEAWRGLAQYAKDHDLALDMAPDEWRRADALLRREIAHLEGTELVQHQAAAEAAYATAVDTFRSNVASALYDNFTRLRHQIATLNRTLQRSPPFSNDERYEFRYEVVAEFRELHRFIAKAAEVGETDSLFGSAGEVPAAFRDILEDKAGGKGAAPSPLDDYRRFFRFEIVIKQGDAVIGTLSERMRSGSGGEHRAPLYVIAGAALAAAYGKGEGQQGGLGVIMLDEFGDKIDAQNARATTDYLRSLGLQLILAAPDTAQGTLTGVLDSYVELFRDGAVLQMERIVVRERGRELLASDQFQLHPELLEREIARIRAERAPA